MTCSSFVALDLPTETRCTTALSHPFCVCNALLSSLKHKIIKNISPKYLSESRTSVIKNLRATATARELYEELKHGENTMPIFINTRRGHCESRMAQAFLPRRLQQSLTRFLSDTNASKIYMDSKYENLQVPDNSLSANTGSRMEDSVFTVSSCRSINWCTEKC